MYRPLPKRPKIRIFGYSVVFCAFVLLLLPKAAIANVDLQIVRFILKPDSINPGQKIKLTYSLRSIGRPSAAFNMGIFIRKGPNGRWTRRWGLPGKMMEALEQGKTVSQTWTLPIPNWGRGTYKVSIHADVDNYLHEPNRNNNKVERILDVGLPTYTKPVELLPSGGKKVKRTFRQDGSVEIRFPDGHGKILSPDGTVTTILPDGSMMTPYSLQVPMAGLPALPGELSGWAGLLQENLLGIIEGLLNEEEMGNYLKSETDKDFYDLTLWRVKFISFILSEQ